MFATRAEKPSPNDIEGGEKLKQPFIPFWWVEIKSTPELAHMKLVASTGKKDEKITILQNGKVIKTKASSSSALNQRNLRNKP